MPSINSNQIAYNLKTPKLNISHKTKLKYCQPIKYNLYKMISEIRMIRRRRMISVDFSRERLWIGWKRTGSSRTKPNN